MRVFWSIVALLAALGLWYTLVGAPAPRAAIDPAPAAAPGSVPEPATAPAPAPLPAPVPVPAPAPATTDTRTPAEITQRIDARTIELDHRFRVIGNGSGDDPYRISWELLTSAGPYIDPARQALTPPPWVRALEGSYIEISAYYSTAVRVPTTRHVLLTLNRWDGCCIGLPPTPFDAIDANLATPLDMKGLHLFRFGTFRGKLVVEPFSAGTYLLGLYRLEDASFVTQ